MGPVSIVVVGLHFGRTKVDDLASVGSVRLVGVCDLDQELARTTAAETGVRHYPDLPSVLADPGVTAVGLFTGPVGRADLVRQAIRAGKHVMTTKPFELDPYAARDVLVEAGRLGRVVRLNSPPAVVPADLARIEEWRASLGLGRPVGAQAAVWASYRETPDGSWYDDPALCPAAPVTRLGIYLVNDLVRLFGPAREVQVMEGRLRTGRPTPDNAHLTIGFAGGVVAGVFASFCVDDGRPYRDRLTLVYEHGSIVRTRGEAGTVTLELTRNGSPVETVTLAGPPDDGYQWAAFADAVRGGQPSDARVVAGVCVLEAMGRAARSRRVEAVLPVGEPA